MANEMGMMPENADAGQEEILGYFDNVDKMLDAGNTEEAKVALAELEIMITEGDTSIADEVSSIQKRYDAAIARLESMTEVGEEPDPTEITESVPPAEQAEA